MTPVYFEEQHDVRKGVHDQYRYCTPQVQEVINKHKGSGKGRTVRYFKPATKVLVKLFDGDKVWKYLYGNGKNAGEGGK